MVAGTMTTKVIVALDRADRCRCGVGWCGSIRQFRGDGVRCDACDGVAARSERSVARA